MATLTETLVSDRLVGLHLMQRTPGPPGCPPVEVSPNVMVLETAHAADGTAARFALLPVHRNRQQGGRIRTLLKTAFADAENVEVRASTGPARAL